MNLHSRDNSTLLIHLTSNLLQSLRSRIINQISMSSTSKENTILRWCDISRSEEIIKLRFGDVAAVLADKSTLKPAALKTL